MIACQPKEKHKLQPHFSTEEYLDQIIPSLIKYGKVEKSVYYQDRWEKDTLAYTIAEWQDELELIRKLNIDTSWFGFFKIDTNKSSVVYKSTREKIPLKELIHDLEQPPTVLKIQYQRINAISQFQRNAIVDIGDSIVINNHEELLFMPDSKLTIKYRWLETTN